MGRRVGVALKVFPFVHITCNRNVILPNNCLVKRILCYIKGTLDLSLHLSSSSSVALTAYFDADWAGCPDTRRSTSGYCVYLGDNLISWLSKRQTTVSRSSAEAEYRAVAHVVAECCWIRQLLGELHHPLTTATVVFLDNVSTVYMASNPVPLPESRSMLTATG
jgi:hypothetical protein